MPEVDYLTKAIENLEAAMKTMHQSDKAETIDIVEELIYLRARISQGEGR
jgi:hypothetical protein